IEVMHHKIPVFGYRINNFSYITDANFISAREMEKLKGSEIIVLDALQKTEHISHFTLDQALEILEKLKPKQAYLIHLSHRMGLHQEVENELPAGVSLAYDGLKIEIK